MTKTPNIPFYKSNIPAGIHLSVVMNIESLSNDNVLITLSDFDGRKMDVVMEVGSKRFKKLVFDCGLKSTSLIKKKDIMHKKVWILIRSIISLDESGNVLKKENILFDTSSSRPNHKDDPENYGGELMGDFVEYKVTNTIPEL
jgi:hypothetical protein